MNYEKLLSWVFHVLIGIFVVNIVEASKEGALNHFYTFSYFLSFEIGYLRLILFYLFCGM
jgi:hypothetical protein